MSRPVERRRVKAVGGVATLPSGYQLLTNAAVAEYFVCPEAVDDDRWEGTCQLESGHDGPHSTVGVVVTVVVNPNAETGIRS